MSRNRHCIVRQWHLLKLLAAAQRGLRSTQLAERLEVSRPTVDRDLRVLREAGFPIVAEPNNGEVQHRLAPHPIPPLQPSASQLAALRLARAALEPLNGTEIVQELDALLAAGGIGSAGLTPGHSLRVRGGRPDVLRVLDGAIGHGRQVELRYRAASHAGQERRYLVDPVFVRTVDSDVYLAAYDRNAAAPRCFKLARISQAKYLERRAARHPEITEETLFGRSVKAWSVEAGVHEVAVALAPQVAALAGEYPLAADQTLEPLPSGGVRVSARVAGLVEARQWVLRWGGHAEALSPAALREAVRAEVKRAAALYERGPGPKSTGPRTRSLTKGERRAGYGGAR